MLLWPYALVQHTSSLFTLQANFVKITFKHVASLLVLDMCTSTFLFPKNHSWKLFVIVAVFLIVFLFQCLCGMETVQVTLLRRTLASSPSSECASCLQCFDTVGLVAGRACKKMGDGGGGHWLVQMEWHRAGWSVCLPVSSLVP